jgi:hypothetical protein
MEGLGQMKNPATSSGIETAIFLLVAKCLSTPLFTHMVIKIAHKNLRVAVITLFKQHQSKIIVNIRWQFSEKSHYISLRNFPFIFPYSLYSPLYYRTMRRNRPITSSTTNNMHKYSIINRPLYVVYYNSNMHKNVQNYWVFGLILENTTFLKLDLFPSSGEGGGEDTYSVGPFRKS